MFLVQGNFRYNSKTLKTGLGHVVWARKMRFLRFFGPYATFFLHFFISI